MFDDLGLVIWLLVLLGPVGLLIVFGPLLLAAWALVRAGRLARALDDLSARLAALEAGGAPARAAAAESPEPAPQPAPAPEPEPADAAFLDQDEHPDAPTPAAECVDARAGATERDLSDRWLVWLGGVALALGAGFLVKVSIDQGWLTEGLRCALGALLGFGLLALGEHLRRRLPSDDGQALAPQRRAAALTAAGLSALFASLYAAHGLYGMIGPAPAFAGLALVSLAGVLLALLHGPFVAALGILGGYAVPGLVESAAPDARPLFALLVVLAGAVALLSRWRPWRWLGVLSLAGTAVWTLAALSAAPDIAARVTPAAALLVIIAMQSLARVGVAGVPLPSLSRPLHDAPSRRLTAAGWWVAGLLLALLALDSGQAPAPVAALVLLGAGGLLAGWRDPTLWAPLLAPAVAVLLVLAGWDLPSAEAMMAEGAEALINPPLPGQARGFLILALPFGAMIALGAHGLAERADARPMAWGGLAAALPLLILAVSYWRLGGIGIDAGWAAVALGLGGMALLAAWRVAATLPGALGAYGVGVLAAVALAATFVLEQAWLTVALALTLPGVAWVEGRLGAVRVPGLRGAALVMAGVVLVRLLLNPYVLDYPLGAAPVFNWLLYGLGLPALAFALAARWFRTRDDDHLVLVLEAGALALAVLLASLEVRHLMAGPDLDGAPLALTETALHVNVWLVGAVLLQLMRRRAPGGDRIALRWAEALLAGAAGVVLLFGPVLWANPLLTGTPVGSTPGLNWLLALYATPALLFGAGAWHAPAGSWARRAGTPSAVALAGLWATLSVRHAFAGPDLSASAPGEAELYAYSLVWLLFGLAVLGAGARWGQAAARRAGLAILLAVTLKAFLIDMGSLGGLWRALSFLGLGAALVGIGALTRWLERGSRPAAPVNGLRD